MTKQELEKIAKAKGYKYGWVKFVMAARAKKQKQKMRPFYEKEMLDVENIKRNA